MPPVSTLCSRALNEDSLRVYVVAAACAQASDQASRRAPLPALRSFQQAAGLPLATATACKGTSARAHSADAHRPSTPGQAARWAKQGARRPGYRRWCIDTRPRSEQTKHQLYLCQTADFDNSGSLGSRSVV